MINVAEWLAEDVTFRTWNDEVTTSRGLRIADLVWRNGGFIVGGWGIISGCGQGCGLDQDDAMELMYYAPFMEGLQAAGIDWNNDFQVYWDQVSSPTGD